MHVSKIPLWYKFGAGNQSAMPNSHRKMQQYLMTKVALLMAQIAVYTGRLSGDLEALQLGVEKIAKGDIIACEECAQPIWGVDGGHRADCPIVKMFIELVEMTPDMVKARLS